MLDIIIEEDLQNKVSVFSEQIKKYCYNQIRPGNIYSKERIPGIGYMEGNIVYCFDYNRFDIIFGLGFYCINDGKDKHFDKQFFIKIGLIKKGVKKDIISNERINDKILYVKSEVDSPKNSPKNSYSFDWDNLHEFKPKEVKENDVCLWGNIVRPPELSKLLKQKPLRNCISYK